MQRNKNREIQKTNEPVVQQTLKACGNDNGVTQMIQKISNILKNVRSPLTS
jgi:hypothetical protein